ncbi:uncharacterized protein LOC121941528 isoform X2 [Plectropomus leopardus]|uniref:uncharacterized protein LOC121941528 isoform X2 n=1 Tax=Plectropomus leopardus TaxID=160734 RepID=UPI001C4D15B3|nr:uncharacterized protein LOC121941528 isoform X2 [Plectropomus leopardus]
MDLRIVFIISSLLVITAVSNKTTAQPVSAPTPTNSTSERCSCPSATPAAPADSPTPPRPPAPALDLPTIDWKSKCGGHVKLIRIYPSNSSSPVCHSSENHIRRVLGNVCVNRKGCNDTTRPWVKGAETDEISYDITDSGAKETNRCMALNVRCTAEVLPDVQGQLQAYKVVTALLCCVLLLLLLIRFTRPTVKALQKRLSDRRQNRWIGPTQSHSVSYHRGKSAVKNNDAEKRVSYPALERLAVSDSREPSSNRNSDYNF